MQDYTGSCGRCYEMRCANMNFSDAYGDWIPRSSACMDPTTSIVIKIVDSCVFWLSNHLSAW